MFFNKYAKVTLDDYLREVKAGARTNRRRHVRLGRFARDAVLLWALSQRYSCYRIVKTLHISPNTFIARRRFYDDHPSALFKFPVMRFTLRGFRCGFCGLLLQTKGRHPRKDVIRARMHVALHVVSRSHIDLAGGVLERDEEEALREFGALI
ncbi:MAG: hypothetical protein FJ039_07925 [Chloroflexi bacterium]|nr:hypothetical protein [Chloroflexota bacterium]